MKVLIYEPGQQGHRPIYLEYIREALTEAGVEVYIVGFGQFLNPRVLLQTAIEERCDTIFICTMDGLWRWLFTLGLCSRIAGIRIVGIYFLFNNLYEGWKGYLWRALLHLNLAHTIFVPDLMYEENVPSHLREKIIQIPDAWDARKLKKHPREIGLRAYGIQNYQSCVLLVLGAISLRKGIDKLLTILRDWDFAKRPHLTLLIAGKVENDARESLADFISHNQAPARSVIIVDRWLTDEEISNCYAASSYLCALYPARFKVSMSTVIRSFAVDRPVIVGGHGMIGELVAQIDAGFVCDVESPQSVRLAFEEAYDIFQQSGYLYTKKAMAGRYVAETCELCRFREVVRRWLSSRQGISQAN